MIPFTFRHQGESFAVSLHAISQIRVRWPLVNNKWPKAPEEVIKRLVQNAQILWNRPDGERVYIDKVWWVGTCMASEEPYESIVDRVITTVYYSHLFDGRQKLKERSERYASQRAAV